MSKVVLDMSMSLDGYVAASGRTPDEPLGQGGERLHEWAFAEDDPRNREIISRGAELLGAMVTGRGTYDDSIRWWGEDGPTGRARLPLFVVTSREAEDYGVYRFVTDGFESAVAQAKAEAGGKVVGVSGARIGYQLIRAGLVDELFVHIVPVLFGGGTPLYEAVGGEHVGLEPLEVIETPAALHVRYRVSAP